MSKIKAWKFPRLHFYIGRYFINNQGIWNKTVEKIDVFFRKKDPLIQKTKASYNKLWILLKRFLLISILLLCTSCIIYAVYEMMTGPKASSRNIFGTVLAVETDENGQVILTVPYGGTFIRDSTLRVHIDQKTRVYRLYPEKERINANEIMVGDVVRGELRKGSEGLHDVVAKEIFVETTKGSKEQ